MVLTHVSESGRDISCPCLVVFSAQLTCLSVRRCWEDQVEGGQNAEPGSQAVLSESISDFRLDLLLPPPWLLPGVSPNLLSCYGP